MTKYWIAVASREHVKRGVEVGIAQVCHGKCVPLNQMKEGDWIVYYSPKEEFGGKAPYQRFTAIGRVKKGVPYQFKMSEDFMPWRRDVDFILAHEAEISPLIDALAFIQNKKQWGFPFRRGCFAVTIGDFQLIAKSMGVEVGN